MIDPYKHCPRCDGAYRSIDQPYVICDRCNFRYYELGHASSIVFYLIMISIDYPTIYNITWYRNDLSYLWTEELFICFDHWLPLDITMDTLKLYLTFS